MSKTLQPITRDVAYIRVSRMEQNPDNQIFELESSFGGKFDEYYIDHGVSGAVPTKQRPAFSRMLSEITPSTAIHFTRVDRWGRGSGDTITAAEELLKQGVALNSLQIGQMLRGEEDKTTFNIHAVLAENELKSIRTRCKSALRRIKAEGTILGKPPKTTPEQLKSIVREIWSGKALNELAEAYSVSTRTLGRYKKQYTTETSLKEYEEVYFKRLQQIAGNV